MTSSLVTTSIPTCGQTVLPGGGEAPSFWYGHRRQHDELFQALPLRHLLYFRAVDRAAHHIRAEYERVSFDPISAQKGALPRRSLLRQERARSAIPVQRTWCFLQREA